MSRRPTETFQLGERLRQVEEHARIHLAQRQRAVEPEPVEPEGPAPLVPAPRRARMYVRRGPQGPGFTAVTLTHPVRGADAVPDADQPPVDAAPVPR